MKTGIERITEERKRQIEQEGWTAEHDDMWKKAEMAQGASAYLHVAFMRIKHGVNSALHSRIPTWPWDYQWWKPSDDPVRNLEKAGALIAAEIDRIQRERNTK